MVDLYLFVASRLLRKKDFGNTVLPKVLPLITLCYQEMEIVQIRIDEVADLGTYSGTYCKNILETVSPLISQCAFESK